MQRNDRMRFGPGRSTVYAPRAAVATSQPLATGAALAVLKQGGNAIDAAIAAAAMLNVTEPYMTGIGGDMFALLWSADEGRLVGLDASGRSGSRVDVDALVAEGASAVPDVGAPAVTVPGALSGWQALLDRFGTRSLADLLQPAIRVAEEGFPLTPVIARDWAGTVEKLRANHGAASTFLVGGEEGGAAAVAEGDTTGQGATGPGAADPVRADPVGTYPAAAARAPIAGEWFRNPDLARTFRRIAEAGPAALYGGELGAEVAHHIERLGGFVTLEDLRAHEPCWVEPLSIDYKGYTLHELPPAGQGVAALQMLKMLESFELRAMGHNSAAYLHTLIEVRKLAEADLARHVADPDHMDVCPESMLDARYLAGRARLVDPRRAADRPGPGALATQSDTIYLSVADERGNMVSFINSLYQYFGSGVVVPRTGFALQNRGAGFTLEAGHPNRLAPRKKPLHTIIPAFVTRAGEPWLSFGVMGGPMQPQGHVQVLLNLLEFGMDVQEAIDAPRFRHLAGREVAVEELDGSVQKALEALGHELVDPPGVTFGGGQAVLRLERGWAAGSDRRKDGMAAGR